LSILAKSRPWQKVGFCEWPVTGLAANSHYRPIQVTQTYPLPQFNSGFGVFPAEDARPNDLRSVGLPRVAHQLSVLLARDIPIRASVLLVFAKVLEPRNRPDVRQTDG